MADKPIVKSSRDMKKATSNYEQNTHLLLDDNNDSPVIILERDQYGRSKPHRIDVLLKKNILKEKQSESVHDLPLRNENSWVSDGEVPLNNKRSLDVDDGPVTKRIKKKTDLLQPSGESLVTLSRGKSISDPSINHFDLAERRLQFQCGRYNEPVDKHASMPALSDKVHTQTAGNKLINKIDYTTVSLSNSLISSLETSSCIHSLESTSSLVSQQNQLCVIRNYFNNKVAVCFYIFIVLIMLVIMYLPYICDF